MDFFYKKIENKGPAAARIGIKGHAPLSQFLNSSFILQLRKNKISLKKCKNLLTNRITLGILYERAWLGYGTNT